MYCSSPLFHFWRVTQTHFQVHDCLKIRILLRVVFFFFLMNHLFAGLTSQFWKASGTHALEHQRSGKDSPSFIGWKLINLGYRDWSLQQAEPVPNRAQPTPAPDGRQLPRSLGPSSPVLTLTSCQGGVSLPWGVAGGEAQDFKALSTPHFIVGAAKLIWTIPMRQITEPPRGARCLGGGSEEEVGVWRPQPEAELQSPRPSPDRCPRRDNLSPPHSGRFSRVPASSARSSSGQRQIFSLQLIRTAVPGAGEGKPDLTDEGKLSALSKRFPPHPVGTGRQKEPRKPLIPSKNLKEGGAPLPKGFKYWPGSFVPSFASWHRGGFSSPPLPLRSRPPLHPRAQGEASPGTSELREGQRAQLLSLPTATG